MLGCCTPPTFVNTAMWWCTHCHRHLPVVVIPTIVPLLAMHSQPGAPLCTLLLCLSSHHLSHALPFLYPFPPSPFHQNALLMPRSSPAHPRLPPSVDICEFVSGEHTPRNLLIRAVRLRTPPSLSQRRNMWREYCALKDYLRVTPHLEKLLGEKLSPVASSGVARVTDGEGVVGATRAKGAGSKAKWRARGVVRGGKRNAGKT